MQRQPTNSEVAKFTGKSMTISYPRDPANFPTNNLDDGELGGGDIKSVNISSEAGKSLL